MTKTGEAAYRSYGDAAVDDDRGARRKRDLGRARRSDPDRRSDRGLGPGAAGAVPVAGSVPRHGVAARVPRGTRAPRVGPRADDRRGVQPAPRPDRRARARADGSQDPLHHDRPATLRLARLQRRSDRAYPGVDALAAAGINYRRAHNQNVVCMPARSTMLTGQYVRTHGVYANGVPLPEDAPSVAAVLADGRLSHRAHREGALRARLRSRRPVAREHVRPHGRTASYGPHRGFEHLELTMHGAAGVLALRHVAAHRASRRAARVLRAGEGRRLNDDGGGDTDLIQVSTNPVPREHYHTDWVADRTIAWLDTLDADDDWFVWMSFPDPHHPWDPPASEVARVSWRDLDLPPGHPGSVDACREVLARKPRHWLEWFDGAFDNREGGPTRSCPRR